MTARQTTTSKGAVYFRPTITAYDFADGNLGCCLSCGAEAEGVEPDARRYPCESCGALKVYGLEELMLMGLADTEDAISTAALSFQEAKDAQ